MTVRIAINGFGRIGKTFLRILLQDPQAASKIKVVAINEGPCPTQNLDLLFKHDSIMKEFPGTVTINDNTLTINNHAIKLFSQANPTTLPWKDLDIDWVIE